MLHNLSCSLQGNTIEAMKLRRRYLIGTIISSFVYMPQSTDALSCRRLNGYDLRKCLREKRTIQDEDSVRDEYLKMRQYEQPGDLVTLPNGFQYRELDPGFGEAAIEPGSLCSVSYVVYRLSSGAYFKYSSGGTPVFMFSLGYGFEGKDDLDSVYTFRYGDEKSLPLAVSASIAGMRVGGRRRILVPPRFGWTDTSVQPRPDTFGGFRRLEAHKDEPLLFEIEVKRIQPSQSGSIDLDYGDRKTRLFSLPAPPTPTQT